MPKRAETDEQKRELLDRLYAAWIRRPELRLGQLICVATRHGDQFYTEDYELVELCELAPYKRGR